jgi:hypothetical protein
VIAPQDGATEGYVPGPTPTPTAVNRRRGFPGKRRINHAEPQPQPTTAAPPAGLSGLALEIWEQLAPECVQLGTLTKLDRLEFEKACRLEAIGRQRLAVIEAGGIEPAKVSQADPTAAMLRFLHQASAIFARYGIGAADRTRIHVEASKPASRWALTAS